MSTIALRTEYCHSWLSTSCSVCFRWRSKACKNLTPTPTPTHTPLYNYSGWRKPASPTSLHPGLGATETCTTASQSSQALALVSQTPTWRLPEAGRREGRLPDTKPSVFCEMWPDWILKTTREVCTHVLHRSRVETISQTHVCFLLVAPNRRRVSIRNPPPHNKSQHCKISN